MQLDSDQTVSGKPGAIQSISVRLTQVRNVSAAQPIFDAIDLIADHCDSCSFCCSNTNLTARSRTSGE